MRGVLHGRDFTTLVDSSPAISHLCIMLDYVGGDRCPFFSVPPQSAMVGRTGFNTTYLGTDQEFVVWSIQSLAMDPPDLVIGFLSLASPITQ